MWIHRAHRNLPSLGAEGLKYSPAWAVGGFFIPIWNLFRPYQVTQEIWKASDPSIGINDRLAWKQAPASSLVSIWWFLWLVTGFISNIYIRMSLTAETLEQLYQLSWAILILDSLGIIAALFAILVVRNIDSRQIEKSNIVLELELVGSSTQISSGEKEEEKEFMWVCDKCGAEVDESDNFCPKCGDKL